MSKIFKGLLLAIWGGKILWNFFVRRIREGVGLGGHFFNFSKTKKVLFTKIFEIIWIPSHSEKEYNNKMDYNIHLKYLYI